MFVSPEPAMLGSYRIVRRLGIGGTSEVLLAIAQGPYGFERTVVIKRLLPKCEWDPSLHRMLAAEAVAYARLTHPSIVRLYDFVSEGGHVALVLEHVDGPSLARFRAMLRTAREPLGDAAALFIASRVFAALAAAHAARDPHTGEFAPVIHRDVSPGNVLIPWDGFVKLGDFGLAKVTGVSSDTRAGMLKGTYGYMAPEQVLGDRVTPRTDVYAGCLLLRELLLAKPTFAQGKMPELELLRTMAEPQLPPIESLRGGISRALADALRRGLARDPDARTLTAAEMVDVLKAETKMERAHASLVAKLASVRAQLAPTGARAQRRETPAHGTAAVVSMGPPSATLRLDRALGVGSTVPAPRPLESRPAAVYDTPSTMTVSSSPRLDSVPDDTGVTARVIAARRAVAVATGVAVAASIAGVLVARSYARIGAPIAPPPSAAVGSRGAAGGLAPPAVSAPAASSSSSSSSLAPPPAAAARDARSIPAAPPASSPPAARPPSTSAAASADPALPPTTGEVTTPSRAHVHRVFVDGQYAAPHSGVTLHLRCGRHTIRIGSSGASQPIDVPCGGAVRVDAR